MMQKVIDNWPYITFGALLFAMLLPFICDELFGEGSDMGD